MRMRALRLLVVMESTATFSPQMYISVAYGSAMPEIDWAAFAAKRSFAESFDASPSNATMIRAGESSLACSALLAVGIPCLTFQRHERIGNWCGSKSTLVARNDAALCESACMTTVPSSLTRLYSVLVLNDAS